MVLNFAWEQKGVSILVIYCYLTRILQCRDLKTQALITSQLPWVRSLVWVHWRLWLEATHGPRSNWQPGCISSGGSTGEDLLPSSLTWVFSPWQIVALSDSLAVGQRSPWALATGASPSERARKWRRAVTVKAWPFCNQTSFATKARQWIPITFAIVLLLERGY